MVSVAFVFISCKDAGAQSGFDTGYDYALGYESSIYPIIGGVDDTTGTGDSTQTFTVLKNTLDELICNVYVDVDSIGGTSSAANAHYFILRGKLFPDDSYTNIDTVTYQGAADSTFTIGSTTAKAYRYWQLLEQGKTDEFKTELQKAYFHFFE